MSFLTGEVVLLPIPFSDLTSRKVRPAVVVGNSSFSGDIFLIPITSQLQNVDISIVDWRHAGLNVPCGLKSQLVTVEGRLVIKRLGALSSTDLIACKNQLRAWFGL